MKESYENIVIEVSLEPAQIERIQDLVNSPMLKVANHVHFVNIYNDDQAHFIPLNIDKKNCNELEQYIINKLEGVRDSVIPKGKQMKNWQIHSLFSNDYKIKSKEYLREIKADLVITSTRGKHNTSGLFCDSLSNYLVSNSPCDVYVLAEGSHHNDESLAI